MTSGFIGGNVQLLDKPTASNCLLHNPPKLSYSLILSLLIVTTEHKIKTHHFSLGLCSRAHLLLEDVLNGRSILTEVDVFVEDAVEVTSEAVDDAVSLSLE